MRLPAAPKRCFKGLLAVKSLENEAVRGMLKVAILPMKGARRARLVLKGVGATLSL